MKKIIIAALACTSFALQASELNSIELITPLSYDRPSSFRQTMTSKLMAGAAKTFSVDIEKKVYDKIAPYKKDLATYYPQAGELDAFIKSTVQLGIKKHLSTISDDNLISFYGFLGNDLIGKFADRILEKEGVTDASRRSLWVHKLTQPFNDCMTTSLNSQYDASHCIDALSASLVPSTGIGLVYELSRASLNSSLPEKDRLPFNKSQAELYKTCIAKTKATAADVKTCALSSMKTGVTKVTDMALTKTIVDKASSKAKADNIKKSVWPSFETCTQKVGALANKGSYTDQFMGCIDNLVATTGTLLVQDKITGTPAIASAMSEADVKKLSAEKSAQFKKCADVQISKGARKDGMLDIGPCETVITNEVTYKVVAETLKSTAKSSIKNDPAHAAKLGVDGVKLLDKCWSNQQSESAREACLRKTIVEFSQNVAVIKLDEAIPAAMPGKSDLNKSSVADLAKCIEKELPENISESNDLTKRLGLCTGKLTRNVALKVADYQIRDTAKGNLSPEETEALVNKMVKGEFAACIGETPEDAQLEKCSDALIVKAATQISEVSFQKEVYGYLEKAGGMKALGVSKGDVDSFLANLTKTNRECVNKKATEAAMDHVNACIKGSIKKIALFFGDIQFNKSVGNMYNGRDADKKKVEDQFRSSLIACLSSKDGKQFSIGDYTKNLYTCSDSVGGSTTLAVAQDQVETSLNQYLKDKPGVDLSAKRNAIKTKLFSEFQSCMSKTTNANTCVDKLKKDATKTIVIEYGRSETKTQVNADRTPASLRPVEDEFIACTEKPGLAGDALAAHLDECTKQFALNFAKQLGTLKLVTLLKQTLGTEDYNAQKKNIDDSIARYNACLDGLKKYSMSEGLTSKLSTCTDDLTTDGLTIVRSSINKWMTADQKDAAALALSREFATFLPCLSAFLPSSPYTQQLQDNIDSSVKPLAVLLAHYIDYNAGNAQQTLAGIIQNLNVDLSDVAKTKKAKEDLLKFLYESGGLDQFLKGIVRGTVKDALAVIPEKDVSKDIREVLLKKETFEEVFNTPEGAKVKDLVMEKLLKPALLEGADMKGVAFKTNMEAIKDNVVRLLVEAPSFGQQALKMGIQEKINEMNGFTKFFAKALYGGDALKWEKVRETAEGKKAEAYIREYFLMPKFKGTPQTAEEQKKILEEAEKMVTKAVKSYG